MSERPTGCSSVPPVRQGTTEQDRRRRNRDGTGSEQDSLKALALQALRRNADRDTTGTDLFHQDSERSTNVPGPEIRRNTDPRQLELMCRRAASGYPGVDSRQLQRFLETAEDPAWCTERVARHLARRIAEGLINPPSAEDRCQSILKRRFSSNGAE